MMDGIHWIWAGLLGMLVSSVSAYWMHRRQKQREEEFQAEVWSDLYGPRHQAAERRIHEQFRNDFTARVPKPPRVVELRRPSQFAPEEDRKRREDGLAAGLLTNPLDIMNPVNLMNPVNPLSPISVWSSDPPTTSSYDSPSLDTNSGSGFDSGSSGGGYGGGGGGGFD